MATLQDYLGITKLRDAWPKWKANVIAINNQVINHVAGTADKHAAQDITYTGDFVGKTEVKAALDQAKTEIDTIVVNASIDPEVAFARDSAVKSKVFGSLDARLEEDEQDLAENTTDLSDTINTTKMSKSGINDDTTDLTNALITAFSDAKTDNLDYCYFDKDLSIDALNTLTNAENLVLMGKANLNFIHADNIFLTICPKISKSYRGKINKMGKKSSALAQFMTAYGELRNKKVTFFSDSIGTGGDMLAVNSDDTVCIYNAAPNGITRSESFYNAFIDKVASAFPDKVFDFYNRGIGGTKISEWNVNKTINSITKPWIEHVKDTTPDVLVVAFGMNHSLISTAVTFAYDLKALVDYVKANFVPIPTIIVTSTPRPVYEIGLASYGNYISQISRQNTANVLRSICQDYNTYLLDVNKISNIKRTGTSYTDPYFKKVENLSDFTNGVVPVGGTYALNVSGNGIQIKKYCKDFSLKFKMVITNPVLNDSLSVLFNKIDAASFMENNFGWTVLDSAGKTTIRSALNIADYTRWGDAGATKIKQLATLVTDTVVRIEKKNNIVKVWYGLDGEQLILIDKANVVDTHGYIEIAKHGTGATNIAISDLVFCEGAYETYMAELSEEDMYGVYNGTIETKSPYGGNSVNHPTSIGVTQCYGSAISELVDDMVSLV